LAPLVLCHVLFWTPHLQFLNFAFGIVWKSLIEERLQTLTQVSNRSLKMVVSIKLWSGTYFQSMELCLSN
jgi:hypothetical protein